MFEKTYPITDEPHIMRAMKRANKKASDSRTSFVDLNKAKAYGVISSNQATSSRSHKVTLEKYSIPIATLENLISASHGNYIRAVLSPALATRTVHGNMSEPEGIVLAVANIVALICDDLEKRSASYKTTVDGINTYLENSIGIIEKSVAMPFATFVQDFPNLTQTQKGSAKELAQNIQSIKKSSQSFIAATSLEQRIVDANEFAMHGLEFLQNIKDKDTPHRLAVSLSCAEALGKLMMRILDSPFSAGELEEMICSRVDCRLVLGCSNLKERRCAWMMWQPK